MPPNDCAAFRRAAFGGLNPSQPNAKVLVL
jgi:hypothetical protein